MAPGLEISLSVPEEFEECEKDLTPMKGSFKAPKVIKGLELCLPMLLFHNSIMQKKKVLFSPGSGGMVDLSIKNPLISLFMVGAHDKGQCRSLKVYPSLQQNSCSLE